MTRIAAVHPVLPRHRYTQAEITEKFAGLCLPDVDRRALLDRLHNSASVSTRHLALPIERYGELAHFGQSNDAFIDVAVDLGAEAILGALHGAALGPADVDLVISTTVTGLAVPSIESRIAAMIGLRSDVKRLPLFGLGCVAGAAGIARLHDYLRGDPAGVAVLLSVELCSLTLQRDDPSTANLVASGLFGDGGAAVVMVGDERSAGGPTVVASTSHLYPDTERAMGWDISAGGLKIVLGAEVPSLVSRYLRDDVTQFLKQHDLEARDITAWVAHPGGPKVLVAVEEALDLPPRALALTRRSLAQIGNLSSASVLHVLRDTIDEQPPAAGSPVLLFAMGPGFCSELVLLRW